MKTTNETYQVISHTLPGDHGTERAEASLYQGTKPVKRFRGKDAFRSAHYARLRALEMPAHEAFALSR